MFCTSFYNLRFWVMDRHILLFRIYMKNFIPQEVHYLQKSVKNVPSLHNIAYNRIWITPMERKKLPIVILALLINGCSWTEAERLSFQEKCENSTEFFQRSVSFNGFNYDELKSITMEVSNAENQILDSKTYSLSDTSYCYGQGYYRIELPLEYDTSNSYNFVLNDGSIYHIHGMKMAIFPDPSMFSKHYGCELSEYWINDQHYHDFSNEIQIEKQILITDKF